MTRVGRDDSLDPDSSSGCDRLTRWEIWGKLHRTLGLAVLRLVVQRKSLGGNVPGLNKLSD